MSPAASTKGTARRRCGFRARVLGLRSWSGLNEGHRPKAVRHRASGRREEPLTGPQRRAPPEGGAAATPRIAFALGQMDTTGEGYRRRSSWNQQMEVAMVPKVFLATANAVRALSRTPLPQGALALDHDGLLRGDCACAAVPGEDFPCQRCNWPKIAIEHRIHSWVDQ